MGSNLAPYSHLHFKYSFDPRMNLGKCYFKMVVAMRVSFSMALESLQSDIVWGSYDQNMKYCHKILWNIYLCGHLLPTSHFSLLTHRLLGFEHMKHTRKPIAWPPTWASHFFEIILLYNDVMGSHHTPSLWKNSSLNSVRWCEHENLDSRLDHLVCHWLGLHRSPSLKDDVRTNYLKHLQS